MGKRCRPRPCLYATPDPKCSLFTSGATPMKALWTRSPTLLSHLISPRDLCAGHLISLVPILHCCVS